MSDDLPKLNDREREFCRKLALLLEEYDAVIRYYGADIGDSVPEIRAEGQGIDVQLGICDWVDISDLTEEKGIVLHDLTGRREQS